MVMQNHCGILNQKLDCWPQIPMTTFGGLDRGGSELNWFSLLVLKNPSYVTVVISDSGVTRVFGTRRQKQ